MKIQLVNPCPSTLDELAKHYDGSFCNICKKPVTDYSGMSDSEMLNHIHINGLGVCGVWNEDQLNREISERRNKWLNFKFLYAALISALCLRPCISIAQQMPDMVQAPCKVDSYLKLEQDSTPPLEQALMPEKRFGTGNVCIIKRYKTFGFYYKRIRLTLLKVRISKKTRTTQ